VVPRGSQHREESTAHLRSGGISGLLAYGIGQLDGHWGYRGWRWIYVLEGFASFCLGLFAFYWIQGDPEKRHRWLTEEEQRFIILRNKFGYGADKGGNQLLGFSMKDFLSALKVSLFRTAIR
jgi:hypothetical protein